ARGIEPRRGSRVDPPELLLPAVLLVVVAVVADPEVGTPGAVPRAEQQRQGAPARLEWLRPSPSLPAAFRANELVRLAPARWVLDALVDIVAEGDCRPGVPVLPGGRERHRVEAAAIQSRRLILPLEPAAAEATQHHVATASEDGKVHMAVAVDVDRVRAGDGREIRRRIGHAPELQRPSDGGVVVEQAGLPRAAGEVQVGQAVRVTIQDRDATTDGELDRSVVGECKRGAGGLVDEARCRSRGCRPPETESRRTRDADRHGGRAEHRRRYDRDVSGPAAESGTPAPVHVPAAPPAAGIAGEPAAAPRSAAAKIASITRRFATASAGGVGVGRPSRMALANASASTV